MFSSKRDATMPLYGVLIDISSGTVGVAIVSSHHENKLPQLLYTRRTAMRIIEQTDGTENLRRVRELLLPVCLNLSQEGFQILTAHDPKARISKVYVMCSSPWSYTVARNVHYENEEPFKITSNMISDLVQSAETEIITHVREKSHINQSEFEIVESATVDMKINDYPVHDFLHLQGVSLELSHIIGLIPTEIMKVLHEIQDKLFPNTELRTHTSMLVMYCVMRELFPKLSSLCIIDVTGQATEFGIVENNLLAENTFIPFGSDTFVRDMIRVTKKPVSDILTALDAYIDETEPLPAEFKKYVEEYIAHATKGIASILERRPIPHQIIITAHKPYEKLFKHMLTYAFKKELSKDATIISIAPEVIKSITSGVDDDVNLALCARFFHKLNGYGELH